MLPLISVSSSSSGSALFTPTLGTFISNLLSACFEPIVTVSAVILIVLSMTLKVILTIASELIVTIGICGLLGVLIMIRCFAGIWWACDLGMRLILVGSAVGLTGVIISLRAMPSYHKLPQPLTEAISTISHGDIIDEIIEGFSKEVLEYYAVFDQDLNKITEMTQLRPDHVSFAMALPWGTTMLHPHPVTSYDNAFSPQDIVTMIKFCAYCSMVVTKRRLYILTNHCYSNNPIASNPVYRRLIMVKHHLCALIDRKHSRSLFPTNSEVEDYAKSLWDNKISKRASRYATSFRWYSMYVSARTAWHFGLDFEVQYLWPRKLKATLRRCFCSWRRLAVTAVAVIGACAAINSAYYMPVRINTITVERADLRKVDGRLVHINRRTTSYREYLLGDIFLGLLINREAPYIASQEASSEAVPIPPIE